MGHEYGENYYEYVPDSLLLLIKAKGGVDISGFSTEKVEAEVLFDAPEFRVVFKGYSKNAIKGMPKDIRNVYGNGTWVILLEETTIPDNEGRSNDGTIEALDLAKISSDTV